jgi:hypothetical protein
MPYYQEVHNGIVDENVKSAQTSKYFLKDRIRRPERSEYESIKILYNHLTYVSNFN